MDGLTFHLSDVNKSCLKQRAIQTHQSFFFYFWMRMDYMEPETEEYSLKVPHTITFVILMKQSVKTVNKSVPSRISFTLHSLLLDTEYQ